MRLNVFGWGFNTTNPATSAPATSARIEPLRSERHLPRSDVAKMPSAPAADSTLNRKALAAHSKVQQQRILANALLGQAIRPEIAQKHMKSVEFDGIGRICGFKKNLSLTALGELQSAVTKPLTQTNTTDERADARPGRDCMIQFMHLLENVKGEMAQKLLDKAKALWMSGDLSDDTVSKFFARAAQDLADMPPLQSMATALSKAVSKTKELTQHNDNMYGRKFDSEFVHALIKNPPAATMDASRKIGQTLLAEFGKKNNLDDPAKLKELAKNLALRPWSDEVPDFKRFMEEPTYDNLKAMLLNVNHGFDILKVQYLVSEIGKFLSHDISWKECADNRYTSVIQPARGTRPFQVVSKEAESDEDAESDELGLMMQTSGYGIGLANHPDYEKYETFKSAKNITYKRMIPDLDKATPTERQGLYHGHPTVTGISGCTNLITYLSRQIASTDNNFSTEQAMLAGMMFLVFDGGHSLNEIMAVHTAVTSSENVTLSEAEQEEIRAREKDMLANGAPPRLAKSMIKRFKRSVEEAEDDARKKAFAHHLENYHLDYRTIIDLAKHSGSDGEVSAAMDAALNKTVDYFKNNSYYMRQNEDLLAQMPSKKATPTEQAPFHHQPPR